MRRNMLIWAAVLALGVAIVAAWPILQGEVPPDEAGGLGASVILPVGYFVALIGAAGLVAAWIGGRSRR